MEVCVLGRIYMLAKESMVIELMLEAVGVTPEKVAQELKKIIADNARPTMLFWDIDEMSRATCLDKTYLSKHVLNDSRMKVNERRRGKGKRIWLYEGSINALNEIIDEWI